MKNYITGFHHAAFYTADFDRSLDFYTGILGLNVGYSWGDPGKRAVMLVLGGDSYLEIFEGGTKEEQDSGRGNKPAGRLLHVALCTDDCSKTFRRVKEAGMEIVSEVQEIDMDTEPVLKIRIAFFKGPDGEVIELFQVRD